MKVNILYHMVDRNGVESIVPVVGEKDDYPIGSLFVDTQSVEIGQVVDYAYINEPVDKSLAMLKDLERFLRAG